MLAEPTVVEGGCATGSGLGRPSKRGSASPSNRALSKIGDLMFRKCLVLLVVANLSVGSLGCEVQGA